MSSHQNTSDDDDDDLDDLEEEQLEYCEDCGELKHECACDEDIWFD